MKKMKTAIVWFCLIFTVLIELSQGLPPCAQVVNKNEGWYRVRHWNCGMVVLDYDIPFETTCYCQKGYVCVPSQITETRIQFRNEIKLIRMKMYMCKNIRTGEFKDGPEDVVSRK